jgi:hypothetical protein
MCIASAGRSGKEYASISAALTVSASSCHNAEARLDVAALPQNVMYHASQNAAAFDV